MNILLTTEYRIAYYRGKYYVESKFSSILKRYSSVFGKITLCTRIDPTIEVTSRHFEISEFIEEVIPINLSKVLLGLENNKIKSAVQKADLVIGRFDAVVSCKAILYAKKYDKLSLSEVMADAWDGYWNHGLFGKLLAPYMYYLTRKALKCSEYALYVTEHFLQNRYPCYGKKLSASNVNIRLPEDSIKINRLKQIQNSDSHRVTLITTGNVDVRAKGHEFVIKAIPLLKKQGIEVKYIIIGGGDQSYLSNIARKCGVDSQVEFKGALPLETVLRTIDECDIYIQPSLNEGLPRSVIEAMSRACPCLGARTAGIPELLPKECIFERKSVNSIVKSIVSNIDKSKMIELSLINFEKAKQFSDEVLSVKRNCFFNEINSRLHNQSK